mmetsp:Transcript_71219/g.206242  ORF Transcript_71219/g.206242 Transcript_71219/m.206242 type:complete len:228 (-) Transcript_71219:800-1483(-)
MGLRWHRARHLAAGTGWRHRMGRRPDEEGQRWCDCWLLVPGLLDQQYLVAAHRHSVRLLLVAAMARPYLRVQLHPVGALVRVEVGLADDRHHTDHLRHLLAPSQARRRALVLRHFSPDHDAHARHHCHRDVADLQRADLPQLLERHQPDVRGAVAAHHGHRPVYLPAGGGHVGEGAGAGVRPADLLGATASEVDSPQGDRGGHGEVEQVEGCKVPEYHGRRHSRPVL